MKETVLIIDDTPANLQVLVSFLSSMGFRTLIAEDGKDALEQVTRSKPDIILLDIMMPGLDGYETCRRIKSDPDAKDIPILFMTALSDISSKLKGFEAGAVDYIIKPIQKEEVIARVTTHLTILRQRRELQSMVEQRDRFMRIAAHDLRNPLAVLLGWITLGMEAAESKNSKTMFQQMHQATRLMNAIIEDFLDLQKIQTHGNKQCGAFALQPLIEQVLLQQSFTAKAKSIVLEPPALDSPVFVVGNAAYTHQILTNYLSNALKYSPSQTQVAICLSAEGGGWRLEVQDQGPGVRPQERDKLFMEFARISNRPTGGETSTGLGLAIVKKLAEAQGGKVGVEFPEAGGSRFWFELPAAQEHAPACAP